MKLRFLVAACIAALWAGGALAAGGTPLEILFASLLESLDDVVYVEVLLEGEFPAGFKRLQRSMYILER